MMKGVQFKKSSKYSTDNQYYVLIVGGVSVLRMERSLWRWLIGIIDNEIN